MWEGVNPHDEKDAARWRKRSASKIFVMLSHVRKLRYNAVRRNSVMRRLDACQRSRLRSLANMVEPDSAQLDSSDENEPLQAAPTLQSDEEARHALCVLKKRLR